jgi:DNA ligase D-like protein (predicted 3'-phosphoesterase)
MRRSNASARNLSHFAPFAAIGVSDCQTSRPDSDTMSSWTRAPPQPLCHAGRADGGGRPLPQSATTMSGDDDKLSDYRHRRDLRTSPEPSGRHGSESSADDHPRFVIQQHDASTLHWDFRIEAGGVLKSWALPKGPSTDPRDKRLAVATEDHPVDYADFEGVIPEGDYGAGAVIVWDTGRYDNITTDDDGEPVSIEDALHQGKAEIWLEGDKLRGGYALVHARLGGDDDNWLLVKMKDEGADARRNPTSTEPESVLSGRTVDDLDDGDEP